MIKCEACRAFYHFFAVRLINSKIQEDECQFVFIIWNLNYFVITFLVRKCPHFAKYMRRCCEHHFITLPNLQNASGLLIFIQGVISLPDMTPYDE